MVNGEFSDDEEVASGVPQGTVMEPLLFLLYCNHLPGVISPGTRVRLFADDCLIHSPVQSLQDQLILQQDLDSLVKWSVDWGMTFNISKCNIMSTKTSGLHLCSSNFETGQ